MKPRMFKERGWWIVRGVLQDKGLVGVVCIGRGRQMQTAWNDYSRKYNWFKRGCPGMPVGRVKNVNQETRAVQRACQGP